MASIGKKILSAFVELKEDEKTASDRPIKDAPVYKVSTTKAYQPVERDDRFVQYFEKLFREANMPGPDFFEFSKMVEAMSTIPDEKARYHAAFAGLSVQGLDKAKLLGSAAEVSSKSYSIEFETGSSTIRPSSYRLLNEIFESAVVAEGLKLGVYGHTDNAGSDVINQPLSEQRANAVKEYLLKKGLGENRLEAKGFGSSKPIADNNTLSGKSKNRRVEIVLGE